MPPSTILNSIFCSTTNSTLFLAVWTIWKQGSIWLPRLRSVGRLLLTLAPCLTMGRPTAPFVLKRAVITVILLTLNRPTPFAPLEAIHNFLSIVPPTPKTFTTPSLALIKLRLWAIIWNSESILMKGGSSCHKKSLKRLELSFLRKYSTWESAMSIYKAIKLSWLGS